jgi:leucyl/phenylalanyl-tRNA--protein transferase
MPVEPPPCRWLLPDPRGAEPGANVVGAGADLEPGTLLAAYRSGLFPMHLQDGEIGWWSPDPRGILPLDSLRQTRSMRQSSRRFRVTFDEAFDDVIDRCGDRPEAERWINEDIRRAFITLHDLGWAHSVEVWHGEHLVGGLYGVEIGGLFAGESMFHRERDTSKVALMSLVTRLRECGGPRLLDVQWATDHLTSLGAVEIPRDEYLDALAHALGQRPCLSRTAGNVSS